MSSSKEGTPFMHKIFILIPILAVLAIVLVSGFFVLHQIRTPLAVIGENKTIVIAKGAGVKLIAQQLEQEKLIRGAFYFEAYIYLKNIKNLQAGEYEISPAMVIPEIADILSGGKVNKNEVKITIPEGFTVKQIDERLAQTGLIKSGDLINFDPEEVSSFKFQVSSLEGCLFPDTYIFNKQSSLEAIVRKMIDNFNLKVDQQLLDEIQKQGKTLEQIITMASIIQQEAVSSEEMPKIAGVFYNRLAIGMPLQSDATINYITGQDHRQATIEETKINSPYNTYLNKGLPPAPICNPGLDAIKAAIYPEKSDYLYFLHPLEAPTVFSKTLEEHNANKAKWLK